MTAIPPLKNNTTARQANNILTATQAVREGIATHAQKHTAEMRAARARLEESRKLANSAKASK
jgi:hypothetical protein